MNRTAMIIVGIVVVLAVGGGSFYGGTVYGKSQAQAAIPLLLDQQADGQPGFTGQAGWQGGGFQPGAGRLGGEAGERRIAGGMTFGQIESIEGSEIVLAGADNQKVRVRVTDTTLIEKNASVTVQQLEVGESVTVSGSSNEDGTITARSLSVVPAGRFVGGPPLDAAPSGQ